MVERVVRFYSSYHSVVNLYDSDSMHSENIITHILDSAPLTDFLGSGEHLHIFPAPLSSTPRTHEARLPISTCTYNLKQ